MTDGNEGMRQNSSGDEVVKLPLTHSAASDVGRVRSENQDSFASVRNEAYEAFIVADGMGGVEGGAIASQLAIKQFIESLNGDISREHLTEAIQQANLAVFKRGQEDERLAGMGTTFVALCFTQENALLLHVGDSRAYRLRGKSLEQLTRDHTLVQELVDSGALSPHQVENHPVSHMLTRSLGPSPSVIPECQSIHSGLRKGDRFLLCSDGLYNHVQHDEIATIVGGNGDEEAVQELVSLANARGGSDNITVLVVSIQEDMRAERSLDSTSISDKGPQQLSKATVNFQPTPKQMTARNGLILSGFVAVAAILGYLLGMPFTKEETTPSRLVDSAHQEIVKPTESPTLGSSLPPTQHVSVAEQPIDSTVDIVAVSERSVLDTVLPSLPVREEEREEREREKREELMYHLGLFEASRQSQVDQPLADNSRRQLEIVSEFDRCQAQLDKANRRLAVWYERKRLLKEKTPLSIAIEVAVISEGVGDLKEQFDEITWEYLRKVEALRYEPENSEIEAQLLILRGKREDYLRKLSNKIRETVQAESLTAEKEVAELTMERDVIAAQLAKLKRTEKTLRVIAEGTADERKSLQIELNDELREIENEQLSLGGHESVASRQQ
jgi:protein phosphatase